MIFIVLRVNIFSDKRPIIARVIGPIVDLTDFVSLWYVVMERHKKQNNTGVRL